MSASTESLQLKERRGAALNKLDLYWEMFRRKYANVAGGQRILVRTFMYLLVIGLAFVFLYPFLYMVTTSMMSNMDLNSTSVHWIPTAVKFENYAIALDLLKATKYMQNSLLVTTAASFGHLIACSFIGYGFARYRFPLRNVLFACVMISFIVPTQTLIVPLYLTYSHLHWLDTYIPLILPTFFGFGLRGALYVFLFRQFFLTVPRSLEEAARIDGCGFLATYWRIVFPLAKATLVVALVLSVVWHWNDFYEPGLYVTSAAKGFLPPRLSAIIAATNALPEEQAELLQGLGLEDGEDTLNNAVVMAGAVFVSAPVLLFFAFAQRQFMQGIERSGITGE